MLVLVLVLVLLLPGLHMGKRQILVFQLLQRLIAGFPKGGPIICGAAVAAAVVELKVVARR